MKKKMIVTALVFMIMLSLFGCGKKADPIDLPATSDIKSIEIDGGIEDVICTDRKQIESFLQKVLEAKATSKEAIQDVPTVTDYTRVDFISDGKLSSIFVYEIDSEWYIEQPYHGIYKTDGTILDLLKN